MCCDVVPVKGDGRERGVAKRGRFQAKRERNSQREKFTKGKSFFVSSKREQVSFVPKHTNPFSSPFIFLVLSMSPRAVTFSSALPTWTPAALVPLLSLILQHWQAIFLLGEFLLDLFFIWAGPFFIIDYRAYLDQVATILAGERHYEYISGKTGPVRSLSFHPLSFPAIFFLFFSNRRITLADRVPWWTCHHLHCYQLLDEQWH